MHVIATDHVSLDMAGNSSLYYDHLIFLGTGSAIVSDGEGCCCHGEVTLYITDPNTVFQNWYYYVR